MLDKDLEIHRSPRFDLNGLPKRPFTVSDSTCEIPRNWLGSSDTKTRTLLLEKRKKAMIPDITYDVDGDGFVGHTDMAIAKIFDKNRDGVLDEKEIHNMRKAIDEGAMDHYIWGLDQGGSSEHPRLIQHKGKFITEGNYVKTLPLADLNKPMGRTSSQVKLEATKELRAKAECFSEKYFEKHPLKINYVPPIIYEHVAEFQSISEKKKELKKIARDKIGLTEPTDTKDYSKMPKYKYVENPHISSLKEFKAARKQKMVKAI